MFQIIDNTIHLTRGDIASFDVEMMQSDGRYYEFQAGEVLRFKVFEAKQCDKILLQKDIEVTEPTTRVTIFLTGEETSIGPLINKPTKYWYEVELNPDTAPLTLIGYDINGEKLIMLYPEGGVKA